MGFDFQTESKDNYYNRNFPAVDSDGYIEDWWKRADDDYESMIYGD